MAFQTPCFRCESSFSRFSDARPGSLSGSSRHSKLFGPDENYFDDGIGDLKGGKSDQPGDMGAPSGGETLANDFYKQLRQREAADADAVAAASSAAETAPSSPYNNGDDTGSSSSNQSLQNNKDGSNSDGTASAEATPAVPSGTPRSSEEDDRNRNQQAFSKRQVVSIASSNTGDGISAGRKVKFTGRSDSSVVNRSADNDESARTGRTPRQSMMEREFQLAGRGSGASLALQAAVTFVALIFYIYVGLSGGIVTGEDAANADFGGEDDLSPYEIVIPVPRDSEPSVWI